MSDQTAVTVRDLLVEYDVVQDADWTTDAPLISSGVMDSLDLVKMIAVIEDHFDITINDNDFRQENFETCSDIAALVKRSKASV